MERTFSQSEMNSLKKQKAFAWAKVFEYHGRSADDTAVFVEIFGRENGYLVKPAEFPPHITEAMWEMANRLNETYTCPICLDLTSKDTFHLTSCGHILCKDCYKKLQDTTAQKPKCPQCRRSI
jgi:hypothetical protein